MNCVKERAITAGDGHRAVAAVIAHNSALITKDLSPTADELQIQLTGRAARSGNVNDVELRPLSEAAD